MMQISESYNQKKSLFNSMSRFIIAVNDMDQTVMVPSLLRDVPLESGGALKAPRAVANVNGTAKAAYFHRDGDMYSSYVLLKSIRNDIEWGVVPGEAPWKENVGETGVAASRSSVEEEEDLEKQFHFHLTGLHTVLSKLTLKANTLTNRYKEEVGCRK